MDMTMPALLPSLHSLFRRPVHLALPALMTALACALYSPAGSTEDDELSALTQERQALTLELQQYQKTLDILHKDDTPASQSNNAAVRKLAGEAEKINERLLAIARREVILLEQQIGAATAIEQTGPAGAVATASEREAVEGKPLRTMQDIDSVSSEAEEVERLQGLLSNYYNEKRESARTMPSEEEIAQREAARIDAQKLAKIPFNVDKVRLNGAEGSTALGQITERLSDPALAETRRDIAPICSIKTYLYGSLVGSDNRSLTPVGKNHFIARIRLQPGDTTLRIRGHRWEVRLPQNVSASDFLLTFYNPAGSLPELHIFSVDELLAQEDPHIPAWLPEDININSRAG